MTSLSHATWVSGVGAEIAAESSKKYAALCRLAALFFFSSRRRHTRLQGDWSSDVCSSDLSPYRDARRVFWIVDNGSSHRGEASVHRLHAAFPNLVLVHSPVHASWLNQIEI